MKFINRIMKVSEREKSSNVGGRAMCRSTQLFSHLPLLILSLNSGMHEKLLIGETSFLLLPLKCHRGNIERKGRRAGDDKRTKEREREERIKY
jgi:hypothetical protein